MDGDAAHCRPSRFRRQSRSNNSLRVGFKRYMRWSICCQLLLLSEMLTQFPAFALIIIAGKTWWRGTIHDGDEEHRPSSSYHHRKRLTTVVNRCRIQAQVVRRSLSGLVDPVVARPLLWRWRSVSSDFTARSRLENSRRNRPPFCNTTSMCAQSFTGSALIIAAGGGFKKFVSFARIGRATATVTLNAVTRDAADIDRWLRRHGADCWYDVGGKV